MGGMRPKKRFEVSSKQQNISKLIQIQMTIDADPCHLKDLQEWVPVAELFYNTRPIKKRNYVRQVMFIYRANSAKVNSSLRNIAKVDNTLEMTPPAVNVSYVGDSDLISSQVDVIRHGSEVNCFDEGVSTLGYQNADDLDSENFLPQKLRWKHSRSSDSAPIHRTTTSIVDSIGSNVGCSGHIESTLHSQLRARNRLETPVHARNVSTVGYSGLPSSHLEGSHYSNMPENFEDGNSTMANQNPILVKNYDDLREALVSNKCCSSTSTSRSANTNCLVDKKHSKEDYARYVGIICGEIATTTLNYRALGTKTTSVKKNSCQTEAGNHGYTDTSGAG